MPLVLIWAMGLLGIHLLPLRWPIRALVAVAYGPIATGVMVVSLLSAACGWHGGCP